MNGETVLLEILNDTVNRFNKCSRYQAMYNAIEVNKEEKSQWHYSYSGRYIELSHMLRALEHAITGTSLIWQCRPEYVKSPLYIGEIKYIYVEVINNED